MLLFLAITAAVTLALVGAIVAGVRAIRATKANRRGAAKLAVGWFGGGLGDWFDRLHGYREGDV